MKHYKRLPVEGLCNCRDLGGFAANGGVTRYGVFLRSEAPCYVTEAGIQWLRDYGLTTTYDLRGQTEIDWRPSALRDAFAYGKLSLAGGAETFEKKNLPPGEFSWDKVYIKRAKEQKEWIRHSIETLVHTDGCALFHCTTGKDRTGILTCCLLGAVGVSREDIAADYCLSQVYLQDIFSAMRDGSLTIRQAPQHYEEYVFQTPFTAMEKFYDYLTEVSGSVRQYLLEIGVRPDTLSLLDQRLVET